jgi:hypothetical protein
MIAPRRSAVLPLLAVLAGAAPLPQDVSVEPSRTVTVVTYAGTGRSGNSDGPLATATFGSPSGLAAGPHGVVYVVDKALNTLRIIENGEVRTLVGSTSGDPVWRAGGYQDGPLATAAFNHPEGVAVAPDGSIVVADTLNSAVRRVKDGAVTTIAGGRYGSQDGPVATATFKFPVGVAVDPTGNVYVADQQTGVREISNNGVVSTLPIPNVSNATAVALGDGPDGPLWVADESGLVRWNVASNEYELRFASSPELRNNGDWADAHVPIGHPYALAADGHYDAAYTDVADNSIHRVNDHFDRGLAGGDPFDPNVSGGYVDGTGAAARFYAPLGIVRVPAGWIVADAGNHRLRLVSPVDDRQPVTGEGTGVKRFYSARRPAVALIGNSQIWSDTDYANSIAGRLHELMPGTDIVPFKLAGSDDPQAIGEFAAQLVAPLEKVEATVYVFNAAGVLQHGAIGYEALRKDDRWPVTLAAQLAAARKALGDAAARVLVVDMPLGDEASPNEISFVQQIAAIKATAEYDNMTDYHERAARVLAASGFTFVDAWPAFRDADRDGRGPLFGPTDGHLGPKGRALLADVIYAALERRPLTGALK